MTTVLSVHTSDGCVGRCDAKCHNARGPACRCICAGANHGVGGEQALENAAEMGAELLQRWHEEHGDLCPAAMQLPLPLSADSGG